jgi:hypothetical protein
MNLKMVWEKKPALIPAFSPRRRRNGCRVLTK